MAVFVWQGEYYCSHIFCQTNLLRVNVKIPNSYTKTVLKITPQIYWSCTKSSCFLKGDHCFQLVKRIRMYPFFEHWFWNDVRRVIIILKVGLEVLKNKPFRNFLKKVAPIAVLWTPLIFHFDLEYFNFLFLQKNN